MIHTRPRLRDLPAAIFAIAVHLIATVRERWDGYLTAARAREAAEARERYGLSDEAIARAGEVRVPREPRHLDAELRATGNVYPTGLDLGRVGHDRLGVALGIGAAVHGPGGAPHRRYLYLAVLHALTAGAAA